MYGDFVNLHACMYVCDCVCACMGVCMFVIVCVLVWWLCCVCMCLWRHLYGDCVVFVCVSGYVCMVIV